VERVTTVDERIALVWYHASAVALLQSAFETCQCSLIPL
jgi:hypothetical protein